MFLLCPRRSRENSRNEGDTRRAADSFRVFRSSLRYGRSLVGIAFGDWSFDPSDFLGRNSIQGQALSDRVEPTELATARAIRRRHRSTGFSLDSQSISDPSGTAEACRLLHFILPDRTGIPRASRFCQTSLVSVNSGVWGRTAWNHSALHF